MEPQKARTRLTAGRVADFACPPGKSQAFLWDTDIPALLLRCTPGGRKTYAFEARLNGDTIRATIGTAAEWSLEAARARAAELKMMVDKGIDPREVQRQQQAERAAAAARAAAHAATVGEAWAVYVQERSPHWGERHRRDNECAMRAGGEPRKRGAGNIAPGLLAEFAGLRLSALTPERVEAWAARQGQERPTQARLALRLLRAFLNWCEAGTYRAALPDANAAKSRRARESLGKAGVKTDALLKEQLPAWFAAVRGTGNATIAAYLQALLLTGARPGELLALRWEDVNTQWRGLSLRDKAESKGGSDGTRTIPLTPYVWHLLAGLPRRGPFVFSGTSGDKPIEPPRRRHNDACAVAGVEHLTLHGLRRSFGSLSEWLELPAGVVAQIQGHKPSATAEKHYRVRPLDLLRVHHEKLEAWILQQAGVHFDATQEPGKLRVVTA